MVHRRLALFLFGWGLILAGSSLAHLVQTAGGIRVFDLRFPGATGKTLSALLYVPPTATTHTKAPGILAVHGDFNSRETQSAFAIEFARRGYVVLAMDQTGHGYSDPPAFADGFGGPDGLRFLRGLDMVDVANIGLEGHGMGGWAILKAAEALPDGYRAMVLEGSSTGTLGTKEGTPIFPRNLAVVFSRYDEFSRLMWGIVSARDIGRSEKLTKLFGITAEAQAGRLYGKVQDGTARMLLTPPGTHPMDHLSREAVADSLFWFARTLAGGRPFDPYNQIWMWKELGTATALAGFVVMLLGSFDLLLKLRVFAGLEGLPDAAALRRNIGWWTAWTLTSWVPVISFYAFLGLGATYLPAGPIFRQAITNQIMVWFVLNALLSAGLGVLLRGDKADGRQQILPAAGIAVCVAAIGYAAVSLVGLIFTTDFRFWVMAIKPMSRTQIGMFMTYLPAFMAAFTVMLHMLHTRLSVYNDNSRTQYASNIGALAAGFLVFLAAQYGALFNVGHLPSPEQALNTILAIQFLPLLATVGIIATFIWRRTGNVLPGAFLCAILVTWYIVAGQATQF